MKVKNMTIAALTLLLAACSNEEILENNESGSTEKVHMTFTAGTPQTRTSLGEDGYAVNWTKGDLVAIYDGTAELCKFEATEVEGSTATLEGEAKVTDTYTAFYPYTDDGTLTFGDGTITFTLPAGQTATAGGFAEGLNPSWAKATDGSTTLAFENLCALVKFTVGEDMAGEGTFTLKGAKSESLAGSLTYTIGGDGEASVGSNASAEVKLSGAFVAGETYYFVVAPATLKDGLSLFYKGSEGPAYRRAGANSVTFKAGKVTDLGTLTLEGFTEAITNSTFIWALGLNGCTLHENADGSVTLTEECKQQLASITSLNLSGGGIGDLSDLRYFTGLRELGCASNGLKTLDVSMLTNLTTLNCSLNQLETLDVSMLTNLTTLYCNYNQLETLDVRGLTNLTTLNCSDNQLETLDVSGLTNLTTLNCSDNQLETPDVSGLTQLQTLTCSNNQLTALPVENLTNLTTLYCNNNQLTALSVVSLTNLNVLSCNDNRLTELDITSVTSLNGLFCGNQTNAAGEPQTLTLILTSAQETKWNNTWKNWVDNARVSADVKDLGSTAHW